MNEEEDKHTLYIYQGDLYVFGKETIEVIFAPQTYEFPFTRVKEEE